MSKEEIAIRLTELFVNKVGVKLLNDDIETAIKVYANIYKCILYEIEEKNKINKAIDYMEKWGEEPTFGMETEMKNTENFQELFKILKGDEK